MVECKVVSESFMQTARAKGSAVRRMNVNARQLFACFEDGESWGQWVPVIKHVQWTSPRPFTVGTTRTVTLSLGIKLEEVFWAWEPERHVAFCITRASNGMLRALAESYQITPIDEHTCSLHWRMAMQLNGMASVAEKYMSPSLEPAMQKLMATLERVAAKY